MNWYKLSQLQTQEYFDIGHYTGSQNFYNPEKKKITLWISDLVGNNFKTIKTNPTEFGQTHGELLDLSSENNYWGRYDPFKNIVSLSSPYSVKKALGLTFEDIPNRLIKRLASEFPGASIYAFPEGIQII